MRREVWGGEGGVKEVRQGSEGDRRGEGDDEEEDDDDGKEGRAWSTESSSPSIHWPSAGTTLPPRRKTMSPSGPGDRTAATVLPPRR